MTEPNSSCWPYRPCQMACDLAGLIDAIDRMLFHDPDPAELLPALLAASRVYAQELALFFYDQPLVAERTLDALEVQWLERRRRRDE